MPHGLPVERYVRTAMATLRGDGVWLLLWRIIVKLVSPVGELGISILYERDLTAEIPPVAPRVTADIRLGTEADVEALLALQRYEPGDERTDAQRSIYVDRFRRGETCFLVCVGSELVAFDWMCRLWGEAIPFFPIILDSGECYGAEAFTSRLWRGRDLHKYVNNYMLRFAQSVGCHRSYTMTDLTVWRSRRNLRRLGWQVLGRVLWFQLRRTGKVFALRLKGDIDLFARAQSAERVDALMHQLRAGASRPG